MGAAPGAAETPVTLASIGTTGIDVPGPTRTAARSCTSCHAVDAALSHPVDVRATMNVSDALPLQAGRITCTTCHLDDNQQHTLTGARNALLRTDRRGAAFCAHCHTPGSAAGASHAARLNRAHLAWPGGATGLSNPFASGSASGVLDDVSRQCMDCHDGSRGTDIGKSHPMGMTYDASSFSDARSAARRLTPRNQLDPRIKLINNTVGCTACHDVYSRRADMLVMDNTRDQLCTTCHAMR